MQEERVGVGWLVAIFCRVSRITRGLYMTWLGGGFWELQSLKAVWKELTMTHRWTTERYDHIGTSRRVNDHMRCLLSLPVMRVTLEEIVQKGRYGDSFELPLADASPSFANEVGWSGGGGGEARGISWGFSFRATSSRYGLDVSFLLGEGVWPGGGPQSVGLWYNRRLMEGYIS